ncbi:MAG: hypothetical protein R6W86_01010 [Marinobacter sp.]|uniref:hypothetical protein n=1 Tax=Marinobacter sp. TaxID=50741 RepID=UPI00396D70BC
MLISAYVAAGLTHLPSQDGQFTRELASDAREWMNSKEGDEAIGKMENRYCAYIGEFDFVDLRKLGENPDSWEDMVQVLPLKAEQR